MHPRECNHDGASRETQQVKGKQRRGRTSFHPFPNSYHAASSGATYALFVILASPSSVSRFSTSGPTISSSHHGRSALCACRIDRRRASSCARNDGGRKVEIFRVAMEYVVVLPALKRGGRRTSENMTWASGVTACWCLSSNCSRLGSCVKECDCPWGYSLAKKLRKGNRAVNVVGNIDNAQVSPQLSNLAQADSSCRRGIQ